MNKKRFFGFMAIGILVAVGNFVFLWILSQGKPSNFKDGIAGADFIAMFFATCCSAIISFFSFGNDRRRFDGLEVSGFADFFSAKELPGQTGLATGFVVTIILFALGLVLLVMRR